MPRRITDTNGDEKILKQSRRAEGLTKLRSRLDQAMDEMLRLHERRETGAELVDRLREVWGKVRQREVKARAPGAK